MTKSISYSKLVNTLSKLGAHINAAETHGLMTGMLSISRSMSDKTWRDTLLENLDCNKPSKTQWEILDALGEQIIKQFVSDNFEFNLLLPGDNTPLADRLNDLCFWCRGYLSGLGIVGITKEDLANSTIKELIADLSQIAHVGIETDASEEDEHNYMELVEYVRIAVQNIQLELKGTEHSGMLH